MLAASPMPDACGSGTRIHVWYEPTLVCGRSPTAWGHEAGDLASRIVVQSLDAIATPESAADLLAECEERLFSANQQILALSHERQGATVGTTAAVLLVRDNYYACIWAGDSRVYLISRGAIRGLA